MAERKVRHATVQYFTPNAKDPKNYETAFRNQIVDIPDDQIERLDSLGATVPVDQDLERPGRMLVLPDTAGDAEILSWVMGASSAEVAVLVAERPIMAGRILAAQESVTARFKEQDEHLGGGGLKKIAADAEEEEPAPAAAQTPADDNSAGLAPAPQASTVDNPAVNSPGAGDDDLIGSVLSAEQADLIVKGNARSVTDYLSENPANAAAILDAESRRSTATREPLRVSIVRSAEAAAGFTAQ